LAQQDNLCHLKTFNDGLKNAEQQSDNKANMSAPTDRGFLVEKDDFKLRAPKVNNFDGLFDQDVPLRNTVSAVETQEDTQA